MKFLAWLKPRMLRTAGDANQTFRTPSWSPPCPLTPSLVVSSPAKAYIATCTCCSYLCVIYFVVISNVFIIAHTPRHCATPSYLLFALAALHRRPSRSVTRSRCGQLEVLCCFIRLLYFENKRRKVSSIRQNSKAVRCIIKSYFI